MTFDIFYVITSLKMQKKCIFFTIEVKEKKIHYVKEYFKSLSMLWNLSTY